MQFSTFVPISSDGVHCGSFVGLLEDRMDEAFGPGDLSDPINDGVVETCDPMIKDARVDDIKILNWRILKIMWCPVV